MPGPPPTVAAPAGHVGTPLTTHAVDPLFARETDGLRAAGRRAGPAFPLRDDVTAAPAPDAGSRSGHTVARMRVAPERTGARAVVEAKTAEPAATGPGRFGPTGAGPAVRQESAALFEHVPGVTTHRAEEVA